MLQTMDGFNTAASKEPKKVPINPTPVTHQYIVGYDSISDSSYMNIPHIVNKK
jgi:hypothetical protein